MGNDDFRRELNSVFDRMTGSPSPVLRDRVRSAVANGPEARGPYWIAAAAAVVIAVLLVSVLYVANPLRRPNLPVGVGQPSPSASPTPGPSDSPSPSPSSTPSTQPVSYACTAHDVVVSGTTPPVAFISALRTGSHGSYDRITIEFANGAPHDVHVSAPGGTTYTMSPSGQTVTIKGDHGILVVIHGADLHTSYSGSIDIVTGYATLAEVRRVEDFEGTVQVALGVNGAGCYHAFWLTNPERLVIDVQAAS